MPMTLSVGVSKKIGQPDYGSLGASCNVEIELDGSLIFGDLETFHQRVRQAYDACNRAVADELAKHQQNGHHATSVPAEAPRQVTRDDANGSVSRNGGNGQQASQKQVDYIEQLARQIRGLGTRRLETLAEKMFDKPLAGLSSMDASGLIDTLKEIKSGSIDLAAALNGAAS